MQVYDVVGFWTEAGPKQWFAKNEAFDGQIRERFGALHHAAARGRLIRGELTFSQLPAPVRAESAMRRAGHRIFIYPGAGREEARDKIELARRGPLQAAKFSVERYRERVAEVYAALR